MTSRNGSAARAAGGLGASLRPMSQDIVPTPSDPARAFEDLRGEVSLLRRAVQGLTAERQNAPDYLPTLQQTAERLDWIARTIERLSKAPAMELSVESLVSRIEEATVKARSETRQLIGDANAATHASIARINAVVQGGWTAERQWRHILWTAGIAFVLGIVLCFSLPRILAPHTAHSLGVTVPTHERQPVDRRAEGSVRHHQ
jgi:hypothetical protein